jgi:hypothetical protein
MFGNVWYHQLNQRFWEQQNYTRAMTLEGKLDYLIQVIVAEPFNWLLPLGCIAVLIMVARSDSAVRTRVSPALILTFTGTVAVLLFALIPTPTWLQYLYAPYALLLFAYSQGTAYLAAHSAQWRRPSLALFAIIAIASTVAAAPKYLALIPTLGVDAWVPVEVHEAGLELRLAVAGGRVATLSPVFVDEAGLEIYSPLASGPFALRISGLLSEPERERYGVLSTSDVTRLLTKEPPGAIVVGYEAELDGVFTEFAKERGYRESPLAGGGTVWVEPRGAR